MHTSDNQLAGIAMETGLRFPAGARLLGVHRERGIDSRLEVKLEMSAADFDELIKASPINQAALEPRLDLFGSDHEFWDPSKALGLVGAQAILPGGKVINLGVSRQSTGMVWVFVVSHGT